MTALGPCAECGSQMRSKTSTLTQFPRTVLYGANGLCSSCYKRDLRSRKPSRPREPTPASDIPLGDRERAVLAMLDRRFTGAERNQVASILGLSA